MDDRQLTYRDAVRAYVPQTPLEASQRDMTLAAIEADGDLLLTRAQEDMHFTASAMILNDRADKVLMAYHNIYKSWAWTGGHSDGEPCLYQTAVREAIEETGVCSLTPISDRMISFDALPVCSHIKRGRPVRAHLHLNATYAFRADESTPLLVRAGENSAVGWLPTDRLAEYVTEADMLPIYGKLLERMRALPGLSCL